MAKSESLILQLNIQCNGVFLYVNKNQISIQVYKTKASFQRIIQEMVVLIQTVKSMLKIEKKMPHVLHLPFYHLNKECTTQISKKLDIKCPHLASLSPQINSQWIHSNTDS